MAGLIPLMLQPASGSSRASAVFPQSPRLTIKSSTLPRPRPTTEDAEANSHSKPLQRSPRRLRSQSDLKSQTRISPTLPRTQTQTRNCSSPTTPEVNNTMTAQEPSQPELPCQWTLRKPLASQSTGRRLSRQVPSPLPALPFTRAEWTMTIAEVKRHYLNRQYRHCSTRCIDILNNIKHAVS
jgi:hypothetical protein